MGWGSGGEWGDLGNMLYIACLLTSFPLTCRERERGHTFWRGHDLQVLELSFREASETPGEARSSMSTHSPPR